jgi:UDP-galactopyranose mutase
MKLPDLVCLSHLRWNFVFQRPQHLMSRFAAERRVFFIEEPIFTNDSDELLVTSPMPGLHVVVPHIRRDRSHEEILAAQRGQIERLFQEEKIDLPVLWYYTPMALPLARDLPSCAIVYDCMDELSAFQGAPPELALLERELLKHAQLVTTGGRTLYEAKKNLHSNVHAFPSSVDVAHFASALDGRPDPADQASIPHPRLGFFGVIDERMDLPLVAGLADARPDWHVVLIGPIVKIDPATLPDRPNVHRLGGKSYAELPSYLAGWDVALLPFARNESTRFISPTKTPEYLAAGRPVVSTSIRDVVTPYGDLGLARIADSVPDFVAAVEDSLTEDPEPRRAAAARYLARLSWDRTFARMKRLVDASSQRRRTKAPLSVLPVVVEASSRSSAAVSVGKEGFLDV